MLSLELAKNGGDVLTVPGWPLDGGPAQRDVMVKAPRELRTSNWTDFAIITPLFGGASGLPSQVVALSFTVGAVVGLVGLGRDDGLVGTGFLITLPGFALVPFALRGW